MSQWKSIRYFKGISFKDKYWIYFKNGNVEMNIFNNLEDVLQFINKPNNKPLMFKKIETPEPPPQRLIESCDLDFTNEIQKSINAIQDKIIVLMSGIPHPTKTCKIEHLNQKICELESYL